ncbi:laccase domain protein [Kordiimonas sediminis]|uniref:Purine nucleoside phosphorylase n=1 Tax=Kordiimonas sediminis TaxID=1735581 RepID=A0A919E4G8_9PROT|nr:laccase domain protein [Kordiimonas sediminis]
MSKGVYSSLNCGPGSNDNQAHVTENRRIVADTLSGSAHTPLLSCYQIHSNIVHHATKSFSDNRPQADALVTRTPGLILGILTADCTPVLFYDPEVCVIGAAHAGWKGALTGILENTVSMMETLGADRQRIQAAIGPTIHQPSYEVDKNFLERFLDTDANSKRFFENGKDADHHQFDLPGYVENRLQKHGIEHIWQSGTDTYSSSRHFSYRRSTHKGDSDYGRQISVIMLP